ncbi:MAG: class I fructose-bisphosphate aldolase, partial [Promethearchaeota archaeon]
AYRFKTRRYLPEKIFYMITEEKKNNINKILAEEYNNRIKRDHPWDNNLVIIAADHPARRVTNVGSDELAMGDRQQYLGRIVRVLMLDEIDGVMTTPDIMDDLFILNYLFKQKGGKSFLDNKILIGCTNRGGLSGSTYEMDDAVTAYTIEDINNLGLDGAKMMFRLDLETNMARYSQRTLETCSKMIRECNKYNLPVFLEPLPVERQRDGNYIVKMNSDDLIKTIGIATALGGFSYNIWLKIPYVENYEYVVRSTSNPILMLGGASTGNPTDILENFEKGLGCGSNVCGCLLGRNLLFPGFDDPRAVGLAVSKIIKNNISTEEAVKILAKNRGQKMDFLTSKIMGLSLTSAEVGYL